MNVRVLIPVGAPATLVVKGRTYSGTEGSIVDAPDFDTTVLVANGWWRVAPVGPTSARPTGTKPPWAAVAGATFYDTTLDLMVMFDGTNWRSIADGSAV